MFHNLILAAQTHPYVVGFFSCSILSVLVNYMPAPDEKSGKGYTYLFNVAHGITGIIFRIPWVRQVMGNGNGVPKA